MAEANQARDAGNWAEAATLYKLAMSRKPRLRHLRLDLAKVLEADRRVEEAFQAFAALLSERSSAHGEAEFAFANFLRRTGNIEAANYQLRRAELAGYPASFPGPLDSPHRTATGTRAERKGAAATLRQLEWGLDDLVLARTCARELTLGGHEAAAEVVSEHARLRAGFATECRRSTDPGKTSADDMAELLSLAAQLPALPDRIVIDLDVAPRPISEADLAHRITLEEIRRYQQELVASLAGSPTREALAGLTDLLEAGWRTFATAPPKVALDPMDIDVVAGRSAWNSLRDFMLRTESLWRPPFGSAAIFHAAARLDHAGLGPYLLYSPRTAGSAGQAFRLLQHAAPPAASEAAAKDALERGTAWLGPQLARFAAGDFADGLAAARLTKSLASVTSAGLRLGRETYHSLRGARDGFLLENLISQAASIQELIVRRWPDNADERRLSRELKELAHGDQGRPTKATGRSSRAREEAAARLNPPVPISELAARHAVEGLAPEIAPRRFVERPSSEPRVDILKLGSAPKVTQAGHLRVMRGIEAIRIRWRTPHDVDHVRIRVDGRTSALTRPSVSRPSVDPGEPKTYIVNAWIDLSRQPTGLYLLDVTAEIGGDVLTLVSESVFVQPPHRPSECLDSDAVVPVPRADCDKLEAWIDGLPSVARQAERALIKRPRRVLVVRADQLGDFVTSVPAILRLRELLPDAELYGLVTPANENLARSLGTFSEVETVDLLYSHETKLRHLAADQQAALADRLARYAFDVAIDLSPGSESRALLRLSGAPNLVGFKPALFPFLTFGIDAISRDPVNGKESASHSSIILSLVEAFGATLPRTHLKIRKSVTAGLSELEKYGVSPSDRFVLLHSGARIDFKRWPFQSYLELARLLVRDAGLKVFLLSDDPVIGLVLESSERDHIILLEGRVPFDDFEAMIAHADVVVGNDTGPKHLAALRGARVVSIHMGQVNWNEWGQEGDGLIVSRRVPCNGCGIDRTEDCGRNLACLVRITPAEVYKAVQKARQADGEFGPVFELI